MQDTEMLYDGYVFVFSEIKYTGLFFVYACHHPLIVSNIIVNFFGSVSNTRNNHQRIL